MQILRQADNDDGSEMNLAYRGRVYWQGFVLTGLPKHMSHHENKPKTLSSAVKVWNKVAQNNDKLTIQEVSAMISNIQH